MEDFRKLSQIPVPYLDQLNMQAAYPYSNQMDLRSLFQVDPSQGLAMLAPLPQMPQDEQAKQMYELLQQQQQQQIDPYALAQLYPPQYEGFFPPMFQPQSAPFLTDNQYGGEEPKKMKKQYQTKKRQKMQQIGGIDQQLQEFKGEDKGRQDDLMGFQKQEFYQQDFLGVGDPSQNSNLLRLNQRQYPNQKNENGKRIYIKKYQGKVKRWTKEEALLYEKFIEMYLDIMRDSSSKRNKKIFLLMSKFIGTKSPSQCRSHHQKFFKKVMKQIQKSNGNNNNNNLQGVSPNQEQLELMKMEEQLGPVENQQGLGGELNEKKKDIKNINTSNNNNNNTKKQPQSSLDANPLQPQPSQQNKLLDLPHIPQMMDNQNTFGQGFFPGAFNPMLLNQNFFNYQNNDLMGLQQFNLNSTLQGIGSKNNNQLSSFFFLFIIFINFFIKIQSYLNGF